MAIFLLIVILIFGIIMFTTFNSKFKNLQDTLYRMNDIIYELKKELQLKNNQPLTKTDEQTFVILDEQKPVIPKHKTETIFAEDGKENTLAQELYEKKEEKITNTIPDTNIESEFKKKKTWFENFKENNPDIEKFIGENLINKIGILILVLGISFFVKYAIDKDWINETARVGIGILAGSIVMAIAHKLKKNFAAFSSVLVAGAISIFYFTIAIAFHEYQLFSQTVAFVIMVFITAFSVFVSVSYNKQELAVLSYIGGFAVPFMISTGDGNYVVLFTYIAILNIGLLAISYFKQWKVISILAFILTSILFISWYIKTLNSNTLPHLGALVFATINYIIFSLLIVLNNIKNKGVFSVVEYGLLIANTFLFFSLGIGIIHNWGINFKGIFTLLIAVYNLIFAVVLSKKFGFEKNAIYVLIGLVLTFTTLTIPIQFEGNQITMFWAAEAVLLFWLSQKSKINTFKIGAILVQFLALISIMLDWEAYSNNNKTLAIVLNPVFITGIVVFVSLIISYILFKKETTVVFKTGFTFDGNFYKKILFVVATLVLYFTGILETIYQANIAFSNKSSALSLSASYHFVFVALLLFITHKLQHHDFKKSLFIISVLTVLSYLLWLHTLPNQEMMINVSMGIQEKIAFYLHYILFICVIIFGYYSYKMATTEPKINFLTTKIAMWLFVFVLVFIFSNELMIHGLQLQNNMIHNVPNNSAFYLKFDQMRHQVVKIGYPILWGTISFILLLIGIKKQQKNLRIIALSLLGLTIIKLFVYDINNASETGKIIAFILLGVLILVISFVYQKIKKLVVDDTSKNTTNEL